MPKRLIADIIAAAHKRSEEINALDEAWRDTPTPRSHEIDTKVYQEIDPASQGEDIQRFAFYCWDCDHSEGGFRTQIEVTEAIEAHSRT